jgi:hypothetical protein
MHRQTGFEGAGAGNGIGIGIGSGSDGNRRSSLSSNTGTGSMNDAHAAEGIIHESPAAGMNSAQMVLEHTHVHARQLQLQQHNMLQVQQQQQQHQVQQLSSQLGRISPQHDRYILNSLQHLQIMHQKYHHQGVVGVGLPQQGYVGMPHQQSQHPSAGELGGAAMVLTTHTTNHTRPYLNPNVTVTTFCAMNAATRETQIQNQQEEEDLHKKRLALLIEKLCAENAPNYPPPPVEVFAGACRVEESNVTSYDVLAGRGNRVNNHVGNIRFRELVKPFKALYLQTTTRKVTKPQMCAVLVNYVRTCTHNTHVVPQGRFLKKDPHTQLWVEIGDEKAREKAGQALREDATVIRAELGIAKPGAGAAMKWSKEDCPKTGSADTNNEYESETAAIGFYDNPHKEEPAFSATANKDAPRAAEEEEETEKNGLVVVDHLHLSSPSAAAATATGNIHQDAAAAAAGSTHHQEDASFDRHRVASVPLNLEFALDLDIPPIRSSKSVFHLKRHSASSSSMSMRSSVTAVMGNLTQRTTLDLLEEQDHCQSSAAAQNNDEQELLKQKLRLLMSQRKHRPSSQRSLAGTSGSPEQDEMSNNSPVEKACVCSSENRPSREGVRVGTDPLIFL